MEKIDKLLRTAKREVMKDPEWDRNKQLENAVGKMSTDQLLEIVYGSPDDERIKAIFSSVGADKLIESW